jgi:hypothetical protein
MCNKCIELVGIKNTEPDFQYTIPGSYIPLPLKGYRKRRSELNKKRWKSDPIYRLRRIVSSSISQALKKTHSSKCGISMLKFLPYTITELRVHLESQFEPWMNWENHGTYDPDRKTWQLDHIIPQSKLLYDSMEHTNFQKCWALDNLRPLDARENSSKGNYYE